MIQLSPRLKACCDWVRPGDRVADIGCDHGYLGISLLQSGRASLVIAADLRQQPLESARRNAARYGVASRMAFYLSDGAADIPRDFDTLVCAGMGGDTMISILQAAPWLCSPSYRLILQCQSRQPRLRSYLTTHGWTIPREIPLRDGRFLYTVLEAVPGSGEPLTPGQCWLSPALLQSGSPLVPEYCRRMLRLMAAEAEHQPDPACRQALDEAVAAAAPYLTGGEPR